MSDKIQNNDDELFLEADVQTDEVVDVEDDFPEMEDAAEEQAPTEEKPKRKIHPVLYYFPFCFFWTCVILGGVYIAKEFNSYVASELQLDEAHPDDNYMEQEEVKQIKSTIPELTDDQKKAREEADRQAAEAARLAKEAEAKAEAERKEAAQTTAPQQVAAEPEPAPAEVGTPDADDLGIIDVTTSEPSEPAPDPEPSIPSEIM